MKKTWMKVVILVGVYLLSILFFNLITNKSNKDLTSSMAEATLPIINFLYQGEEINSLHGYASEMDIAAMRDTITPVDESRKMSLRIATYGTRVEGITYEIRSLDGKRFLADGEIEDFQIRGRMIDTVLTVQNLLEEEEEYSLRIALEIGGKQIYYYTRIIQTTKCHIEECLNFAQTFHEYTFSDSAADFIPTYMEKATGDATTLNYVDLTCTLRQITWNNFEGSILGDVDIEFKEINTTYVGIVLRYVLVSINEENETEYYNIEEYYRLRYTSTRMYVMNFERTMNQQFRGENDFIYNKSDIQLGIRDQLVEYAATEGGDVVAFVQEGELWLYNVNTYEIQKVFSFMDMEGMDARDNYNQHDINIARVDEAGSVDFIVYGYMNRGIHEGQVGISICHYDGIAHNVEEQAFIPYDKSYAVLKAEMGQLMYQNELGIVYFMMENRVFSFDVNTMTVELIIDDLKEGSYASSNTNKYFAWVNGGDLNSSDTIQILDLSTGNTSSVHKAEGEYLRPLGFIGEDFVYGIADSQDVITGDAGVSTFHMKALEILATSEDKFQVLKRYEQEDYYISDIEIENYTIFVNLLPKNADSQLEAMTDKIKNRSAGTDEITAITTTKTQTKQTQVQIALKKETGKEKIKLITSRIVTEDKMAVVELPSQEKMERFYVYRKGEVILATDRISEAILLANQTSGVVVDQNQTCLWLKTKKSSQEELKNIKVNAADGSANSVIQSISALLEYAESGINVEAQINAGFTPIQILETALNDSVALDLTGCTLETVCYYISNACPVFASTGEDSAVLLIGYSSSKVTYYNPQIQNVETVSMKDAAKKFEAAGNVFFSYLHK